MNAEGHVLKHKVTPLFERRLLLYSFLTVAARLSCSPLSCNNSLQCLRVTLHDLYMRKMLFIHLLESQCMNAALRHLYHCITVSSLTLCVCVYVSEYVQKKTEILHDFKEDFYLFQFCFIVLLDAAFSFMFFILLLPVLYNPFWKHVNDSPISKYKKTKQGCQTNQTHHILAPQPDYTRGHQPFWDWEQFQEQYEGLLVWPKT